MQTRDAVKAREFFKPSSVKIRPSKTWEKCSIAFVKSLKKKQKHSRVYILTAKHTYRPMRARVIFHDHVFVDSKCTYTRDGKRKGETECRTKESAEEGTKAENKGNIAYAQLFFSSRYQYKSNRKN